MNAGWLIDEDVDKGVNGVDGRSIFLKIVFSWNMLAISQHPVMIKSYGYTVFNFARMWRNNETCTYKIPEHNLEYEAAHDLKGLD